MHSLIHSLATIDLRRSFVLLIAAITSLILIGTSLPASALDVRADDIEGALYETTFYDLVPLGSCGAAADGAGVSLEGKDNIQKGFNYFVSQGYTQMQSAGIIGNLRQESGMNPKSKQLNGGPGRGLAQWTVDGRWVNLLKFAKNKNADPLTLEIQLQFITHEMKNDAPWNETPGMLKKSTTIEDAVRAFEAGYERAGKPVLSNRIKYAKETLAAFGGQAPTGTKDGTEQNPSTDACGSKGGISVNGYSFPVAPQTKRSYTSMPCNKENPNARTTNYKGTRITTCHHDNTPAFDLMYNGVAGKDVYSISTGKVAKVTKDYAIDDGAPGKRCNSLQFKANMPDDKSYYWYGHILVGNVTINKEVKEGTVLGRVATQDYGRKCWGGGPHLHIDRGCDGKMGGSDSCRDPAFLTDLQKIWEGLPE
jgi:hypothetical protein